MKDSKAIADKAVDVVIPVYNEDQNCLAKTLRACLEQTYPVGSIFIVDDGSTEAVSLPNWAEVQRQIIVLRLAKNHGISAARNHAIAYSRSSLLACINTDILPDPDWLSICEQYLSEHPKVGACYTRVVPRQPDRLLTRWRMRFHEIQSPQDSGPSLFAPGHAVLFRREAVEAVGGYDPRYRRNNEDSDICQRMGKLGWETHYVAKGQCISVQEDSLRGLAAKQVWRDSGWSSMNDGSLFKLYFLLTKWTMIRALRNLLKGRLSFLAVDAAIWACASWTGTVQALRKPIRRANVTTD